MEIPLNKKYKYIRNENFDELLKEIGVNFMLRKIAATASGTVELIKLDDETYSFNTNSTFKNQEIKFKPGIEFILHRMDGTDIPCIITLEGNKMIQEEKGKKGVKNVRIFEGDEMLEIGSSGSVVAKRWFKSVD